MDPYEKSFPGFLAENVRVAASIDGLCATTDQTGEMKRDISDLTDMITARPHNRHGLGYDNSDADNIADLLNVFGNKYGIDMNMYERIYNRRYRDTRIACNVFQFSRVSANPGMDGINMHALDNIAYIYIQIIKITRILKNEYISQCVQSLIQCVHNVVITTHNGGGHLPGDILTKMPAAENAAYESIKDAVKHIHDAYDLFVNVNQWVAYTIVRRVDILHTILLFEAENVRDDMLAKYTDNVDSDMVDEITNAITNTYMYNDAGASMDMKFIDTIMSLSIYINVITKYTENLYDTLTHVHA